MWGALKELLLIIAAIAALVALAWHSDPTENSLHTGQTCRVQDKQQRLKLAG
jgi:hypothetical protein